MQDSAEEARMNSLDKFLFVTLHIDVLVLADQQELIYINSVRTQDAVLKNGWG